MLGRLRRLVEARFPGLASVYRESREALAASRPAADTPLGFKFVGPLDMVDGSFEADEVALVERILPRVEIVINIGANAGYYCCIAASAGKHVVAFEPLFSNVQLLMRNVRENGWSDRVEIFPIGLSTASGVAEFFGGSTGASLTRGWGGASESFARLAPLSTADITIGRRFANQKCLVIMDIEGAEYSALKGSTQLLAQQPRPIWMIEIVVDENRPTGSGVNPKLLDTFEMFWQLGYLSYTAGKHPRQITKVDVEQAIEAERNTMGSYNFLFLDPSDAHEVLRLA